MAKITITFGTTDGKKSFKSKEELQAFLNEQRIFWQQFFQDYNQQNPLNQIYSQISAKFDEANRYVESITNDESQIEARSNQISALYSQWSILYSESKASKYTLQLAQKDPQLARYLVGYFTKYIYNLNNDPMALRAIFEGLKFDNGITSNIDAEREALGTLKTEWEEKLHSIEELFNAKKTEIGTTQEEIGIYYTALQTHFTDFQTSKENEFKTIIETYDKKLALQAPVEYWKNRSFWSYCIAGGLAVTFFLLILIIFYNFEPMAKDVAKGLTDKDYYPLIQFASITLVAIWSLRIIVKIFYSKLHLAEEAKEKEMFIKTYLSLLRDSDGIQDASDRHLILQSIFSPSKNGIIQDDGLPMNVIENIVKARN